MLLNLHAICGARRPHPQPLHAWRGNTPRRRDDVRVSLPLANTLPPNYENHCSALELRLRRWISLLPVPQTFGQFQTCTHGESGRSGVAERFRSRNVRKRSNRGMGVFASVLRPAGPIKWRAHLALCRDSQGITISMAITLELTPAVTRFLSVLVQSGAFAPARHLGTKKVSKHVRIVPPEPR